VIRDRLRLHSSDVFCFQAEDGIRDDLVTGVQTCALPISGTGPGPAGLGPAAETGPGPEPPALPGPTRRRSGRRPRAKPPSSVSRSEERRVGKECRAGVATEY